MSIFKDLFNVAKTIVKTVAGGGGSITDLIMSIAMQLPNLISQVKGFIGADAKLKIDEGLEGFDELTGTDEGAIDLVKDLPADKEEEALDHLKELIRILAYSKAKVDGYYIPE